MNFMVYVSCTSVQYPENLVETSLLVVWLTKCLHKKEQKEEIELIWKGVLHTGMLFQHKIASPLYCENSHVTLKVLM